MRRRPLDPIDDALDASAADEAGFSMDHEGDAPPAGARRSSRRDAPKRQSLGLRLALGGGVVFVVGLLATAGAKGYRDLQIVRQREAELGGRITASEQRLEELRHRIELLRDDPATLERLAREELGLVGPDDVVFVLPPEPPPPPAAPVAPQ